MCKKLTCFTVLVIAVCALYGCSGGNNGVVKSSGTPAGADSQPVAQSISLRAGPNGTQPVTRATN
jgi:hypothetical protein